MAAPFRASTQGDPDGGSRAEYDAAAEVQQDLTSYKLRDDWKGALEAMDPVARFCDQPWFRARPLTSEDRLYRALVALRDDAAETVGGAGLRCSGVAADRRSRSAARSAVARSLGPYADPCRARAGRLVLFEHRGALPDVSPAGARRLVVAATGRSTPRERAQPRQLERWAAEPVMMRCIIRPAKRSVLRQCSLLRRSLSTYIRRCACTMGRQCMPITLHLLPPYIACQNSG